MAYLSLEKEKCFFRDGVSALPSPGRLKFGHCVCLSLTRGVGSAVELQLLVKGSVVQTLEIGVCQHSSLSSGALWAGLIRHILNDLELYFLGKKTHKGLFS